MKTRMFAPMFTLALIVLTSCEQMNEKKTYIPKPDNVDNRGSPFKQDADDILERPARTNDEP